MYELFMKETGDHKIPIGRRLVVKTGEGNERDGYMGEILGVTWIRLEPSGGPDEWAKQASLLGADDLGGAAFSTSDPRSLIHNEIFRMVTLEEFLTLVPEMKEVLDA